MLLRNLSVAALVLAVGVAMAAAAELGQGTYTVVSPSSVRPHSEYHVAVGVHGADKDTSVELELVNSGDNGHNVTYTEKVVVPSGSTKTARIKVGELHAGKVRLSAKGEGGVSFSNATDVDFDGKTASLFVQTDKAQYKPGQDVRIRVLVLDPHLKPTVREPINVFVLDGKNNRIKQWLSEQPEGGLWSGTFSLSEQPVLGDWTVATALATSPAGEVKKTFSVAEYVLPTFEVTAKAPQTVAFKQGKIPVTVKAKYTYGKPVVGKATVRAPLPYYWVNPFPPHPIPIFGLASENASTTTTTTTSTTPMPPRPTHVEKVVPIDGSATVEFDIKDDLKLDDNNYWNHVTYEVSVVEDLTGRVLNASDVEGTQVRQHDFDLQFVDTPYNFEHGKLVVVKVKVTDLDGAPVQDDKNPVEMTYNYGWEDKERKSLPEKKVPATGIVTFELEPEKNKSQITFTATYRNNSAIQYLSAFQERESENLNVEVEQDSVNVGDEILLRVSSKVPLRQATLVVQGPLGLRTVRDLPAGLDASKDDAQPGAAGTTVRVRATADMAPASRVAVYGVTADGNLVADVSAVKVNASLAPVAVRIQPGRSEPGREVEVSLSARPNATVALLAVDQSVLLLKQSNNGVTAADAYNERISYESKAKKPWGPGSGAESLLGKWKRWWYSVEEVLEDAGVVYMTNAKIVRRLPEPVLFALGAPGAAGIAVPEAARPMAAAVPSSAASFAGAGGAAPPPPRLRTLFPETWLWENFNSGADGNVTLKRVVPDTITSWVVSALAVDPEQGLGLSDTTKLTVFRPFFATLNLPYSVIRGETVQVPVIVFNYMDEDTTATVTLDNEHGEFEFAGNAAGGRARREGAKSQTRQVKVPRQGAASATFDITPRKVGHVMLKVTAVGDKAGDALERPLKVKAEGETQYRNKAIPVSLVKEKTFKAIVPLEFPENTVPDSETVEVSAIGDVLGPSTANLDTLIRMPFGCGEQNMLNFVPNIVIMKYLNHTNKLTPVLERKARSFTEMGYQKEMTYRHKDGSFSAFGESDRSGSTWLTAFVAKSFRLAKSLVPVEERVIEEALEWLSKQQAENGSFPEVGTVSHRDMQGGSAKGLALTAYVLTAFLQEKDATFKHQDAAKKALDYLVKNMASLDDPYAIAITTYALHLAGHPSKDEAFKMLDARAQSARGLRWWNKTEKADPENPFWGQPNSVNVEMTAYALLTYLERGLAEEAFPIMQWLIEQRNSNGGFASTQDTVVGLQALAAMAERIALPSGDMRIVFSYAAKGAKQDTPIVVNAKTGLVLQRHELPRDVREVELAAEGSGFSLAQVSWSYNEATVGKHPLFKLRAEVADKTTTNLLVLRVCSSFIAGPWGSESNMAVVEVSLPSGFTVDQDALPALKENGNVKRVETKDQDTVLVLYFDKMETKEYCVEVSAIRTHLVSNQKPVPVTVYDYYDQTRRARVFYEPPAADLADKGQ
ncbi:pregnancy zone protein-like isoform X2 [Thrips palmi]|uniref:TEP1-F n=1 Tax=Thrips palmi TaxID=161013 RepID=A0A6P8YP96_THRPL|nr:pregnancy zone protein-like isoform X2 [Thrips palmi]